MKKSPSYSKSPVKKKPPGVLSVVHFASEYAPVIWGGLGLSTLGIASTQNAVGCDVVIICPYSVNIKLSGAAPEIICTIDVLLPNNSSYDCIVLRVIDTQNGNIPVYFLQNHILNGNTMYAYSDEIYLIHFLFSMAALKLMKDPVLFPNGVDIVHCHDWVTCMLCYFLKLDHQFTKTCTVLTVHNFMYQGTLSIADGLKIGLDSNVFNKDLLSHSGDFSLLRNGLFSADFVTTVSQNYCQETLRDNLVSNHNTDILLKRFNAREYEGIVNGVEKSWDPENDKALSTNYTVKNFQDGKTCNKRVLQELFRLEVNDNIPVICTCARLTIQKGIDMLLDNVTNLLTVFHHQIQIIIIGNTAVDDEFGVILERRIHDMMMEYPRNIVLKQFTEELERIVIAGSDLYYMCSRFEPCGLGNLHAMKYGCVVVATKVGGLVDSTKDYRSDVNQGNGFFATSTDSYHIGQILVEVIRLYNDNKETWRRIVTNAMSKDSSWALSVSKYIAIYKELLYRRKAFPKHDNNHYTYFQCSDVESSGLDSPQDFDELMQEHIPLNPLNASKQKPPGRKASDRAVDAWWTRALNNIHSRMPLCLQCVSRNETSIVVGSSQKKWFEFNYHIFTNMWPILMSCRTMPGKDEFYYVLFKSCAINMSMRTYFILDFVHDGDVELIYGTLSLVWYQFQDVFFTLFGQTYFKFLSQVSDMIKIREARVGDFFFTMAMLFVMEWSNRIILGPLGDNPSALSPAGVALVFFNLVEGMISGGPVDPAINKLRESGLISHRTAMHIFQIAGLTLLFGLFATFGYQKLYDILMGVQFTLATSVYVMLTFVGHPVLFIRKAIRYLKKNGNVAVAVAVMNGDSIRNFNISDTNSRLYTPSPENWSEEIFYFIMVDRFNIGNIEHLPQSRYKQLPDLSRHYGDLSGITHKLDYIEELGITTIVLSPILTNSDNPLHYHGYAAIHMLQVDPRFGTMDDFVSLVKDCHSRGIRVILDFPCNHMGEVFEYPNNNNKFQPKKSGGKPIEKWLYDIKPNELMSQEHFTRCGVIDDWDNSNQCCYGDFPPAFRRFATENYATQTLLLDIMKVWMQISDIDGFRIDAAKHVHHSFLTRLNVDLKDYAKRLGKDNFLLIAEQSSGVDMDVLPYVQCLGSAYDYPGFRRCQSALHGVSPSRDLEFSIRQTSLTFGTQYSNNLVRFFDNQDTYRFLRYLDSIDLVYIALAYVLLTNGIPMIYYGTEQEYRQDVDTLSAESSKNPADPNNRKNMFQFRASSLMGANEPRVFDMNNPIYIYTRKLVAIRKHFKQFSCGDIEVRYSNPKEPGLFAFSRIYENIEVLVVINTSPDKQLAEIVVDSKYSSLGMEFQDALDLSYVVTCTVPETFPFETESTALNVSVAGRGEFGVRILVPKHIYTPPAISLNNDVSNKEFRLSSLLERMIKSY